MIVIAQFKNGDTSVRFEGVRLIERAEILCGQPQVPTPAVRLRYYRGGDTFLPLSCFVMAIPEEEEDERQG
jgi:hypothetical protein